MLVNKKSNPIITELFFRGRKLNISCFYHTILFCCKKNIKRNFSHYFIVKLSNKQELQQIVFNNSLDIDFKDFTNFYKKCTAKPYSFLGIDTCIR